MGQIAYDDLKENHTMIQKVTKNIIHFMYPGDSEKSGGNTEI